MHVLIAAADVRSATSTKMILAKENLICDTTDLGEDGVQISRLYDYDQGYAVPVSSLMLSLSIALQTRARRRGARPLVEHGGVGN